MHQLSAYCLVITATFAIDIFARWALGRPRDGKKNKPAGLLSLLILCLTQGKRQYTHRHKVIRQFVLSLLIVMFLLAAIYLLLTLGPPKDADVLGFALLITPILTLPFFHFLYGLIGVQPLSVEDLLFEFRLRGSIALIMSANVIFVALEPIQHIAGLVIHFSLVLLALNGCFFLCARQRKPTSKYRAPFQNIDYGLEPMLLHYVAGILEVLYYTILIAQVFLISALEALLTRPPNFLVFSLSLFTLLISTTLLTRIRFIFGSAISLEFYEERALPMSFLLFGLISIVRYYF